MTWLKSSFRRFCKSQQPSRRGRPKCGAWNLYSYKATEQEVKTTTQPKTCLLQRNGTVLYSGVLTMKKPDASSHSVSQQKEDLTYAAIDHSKCKGGTRPRAPSDGDCEYTMVQVSAAPHRGSSASSANDCEDDYVFMGWGETRVLFATRWNVSDHKQHTDVVAIELFGFSVKIPPKKCNKM